MAKKIILVLLILILVAISAMMFLPDFNSVDIYVDGENVTVKSTYFIDNAEDLNREICDYTLSFMNSADSNITEFKNNISKICEKYDINDAQINLDSSIGENQVPILAEVDGTSMVPTLDDGQKVLVNKTKNVHVGDIVIADSPEYGGIIKRVGDINGDSVYLISDNKEVSYEYINGQMYEIKGITTWVDISNINGVVIEY